MRKRDHEGKLEAMAERTFDTTLAASGAIEEAQAAAEKAYQDAAWPLLLSELVREGVLEIVGRREDGELVYQRTDKTEPDDGDDDSNKPVQQ